MWNVCLRRRSVSLTGLRSSRVGAADMETLETLGKRIATTGDLQSIVRTMKSLSAVSIRQYERAVVALTGYNRTIELGLQVLLREAPLPDAAPEQPDLPTAAIVFGSDHGPGWAPSGL